MLRILFSGSTAKALESLCDAPRHSFFQNDKVYITYLGLLYLIVGTMLQENEGWYQRKIFLC